MDVLHRFVAEGGSLLFLVGEGGDERAGSGVNAVTEGLGIAVNADCVVRTVFHKYPHPKEVLITDGLLNRALATVRPYQLSCFCQVMDVGNRVKSYLGSCSCQPKS